MGWMKRLGFAAVLMATLGMGRQEALQVTMVGNAGVLLSDGATSLLVDLPYESGAHGYQEYEPAVLSPTGRVVSVITHHHTDHFDPGLFVARDRWEIIGPPSVVAALPDQRVLEGDSIQVGSFSVIAIRTPHTDDHRSYRIRWKSRIVHVVGDTQQASSLAVGPDLDLLFITPWLIRTIARQDLVLDCDMLVVYHQKEGEEFPDFQGVRRLEQGEQFVVARDSED